MRNVIIVWTNNNNLETKVPLIFNGMRNRRLGFGNDFDVLFLEGYDLVGKNYISDLRNLGHSVHNGEKIYQEYSKKYFQLDRFGDYEKKCFLRWLVIDDYYGGEKIIHYDGDIIFNENLTTIAKIVKNFTFVLQGCPAFTVIGKYEWFREYRRNLSLFTEDIDSYSRLAWKMRKGWEVSNRNKWAGSRNRKIISSDQDLLSHLIHTNQIYQEDITKVKKSLNNYALFENPLYIGFYGENLPLIYRREKGIDYLNNKKVLFWHMQNYFIYYLSKFIIRKKYFPNSENTLNNDFSNSGNLDKLYLLIARITKQITRKKVYQKYFEDKALLSEVFNNRVWWKKGIFK